MSYTKKNIIDSLKIILTRFQPSDDTRLDDNWLSYKIDQVRAELIIKEFYQTNIIDYNWLSDVNLITFHKVNRADDNSVSCDCDISKAFIPQTIPLKNKDGNLDLGVYSLISPCGKTTYYQSRMGLWRYIPEGHSDRLFGLYARINTSIYVNRVVDKLKFIGILNNPEDGYLINSSPVLSGSIQNTVVYLVKYAQIYYNGITYQPGETFVGTVAQGTSNVITTFSGSGTVYLNSQIASYRDVDPYPAGADMVRMIELEILTKEFGIEKEMIADIRNDSKDDASKSA